MDRKEYLEKVLSFVDKHPVSKSMNAMFMKKTGIDVISRIEDARKELENLSNN